MTKKNQESKLFDRVLMEFVKFRSENSKKNDCFNGVHCYIFLKLVLIKN